MLLSRIEILYVSKKTMCVCVCVCGGGGGGGGGGILREVVTPYYNTVVF